LRPSLSTIPRVVARHAALFFGKDEPDKQVEFKAAGTALGQTIRKMSMDDLLTTAAADGTSMVEIRGGKVISKYALTGRTSASDEAPPAAPRTALAPIDERGAGADAAATHEEAPEF
jgi:hypothetical protein